MEVIVTERSYIEGQQSPQTVLIGVPYFGTTFILNFPSVLYVFFFLPPLRHAMDSCARITSALFSPMCLVVFSMLLHYFLFNALYTFYNIEDEAFGDFFDRPGQDRSDWNGIQVA